MLTQNPLPKSKSFYLPTISETVLDWHYSKHHAGYVSKYNEIIEKLTKSDMSLANANYSDFGELKRRLTFNHAGIILHDIYWKVLGNQNPGYNSRILVDIAESFGSLDAWRNDFIATAKSSMGWVLLVKDELSGKYQNILVDAHNNGAYWNSRVIIACDVFEHAYYKDYGPDRAEYINRFIENIDWLEVDKLAG